jgi:hypothetical protein
LQRGDLEQARHWREELEKIAAESKSDPRAASTLPLLEARRLVETETWEVSPLEDDTPTPEIFTTGLSAAKLGQLAVARRAAALLEARAGQPRIGMWRRWTASIMRLEVEALVQLTKGDATLRSRARRGRKIAESMGPPDASPVKPIHELYGECC